MGLETMSVGFWVVVGLMVLCVALRGSFLASLYRKAGPHEALIVYGFRGTRIVKGHGTVIFPMIESYRELSLELMSFDVAPAQDHRPADRRADRQGAGDGGGADARHLRRRHEQDGARGGLVHHQGSARQ